MNSPSQRTFRLNPAVFTMCALAIATLACVRDTPEVVVITATFESSASLAVPTERPVEPVEVITVPTIQAAPVTVQPETYVVQPGDSLTMIAINNGTTVDALLQLNALSDPDALYPGQVLALPASDLIDGPSTLLLADSALVRGPGSAAFDVEAFVNAQPGVLKSVRDDINEISTGAAEIVNRVALEFSVDPRVLLALLEYRSGLLSRRDVPESMQTDPIGAPPYNSGIRREGLYLQLAWAADNLNAGFYSHRQSRLRILGLPDGTRIRPSPSINAGTAALHVLFARTLSSADWQRAVAPNGWISTYARLFGSPDLSSPVDRSLDNLPQPPLSLPFAADETWFFTGGPHGGWGSGSAWAALDFGPPDDLDLVTSSCYISDYFARAAADGVIARTDEGTVVLDLDGDGDESTGWTLLYLHLASRDRVEEGKVVQAGDALGRPSCEGGFSNGTHLHLARRFNGEWVPASCESCDAFPRAPFDMDGWVAFGAFGQEYQGFLRRGSEEIIAEQLRNVANNEISA